MTDMETKKFFIHDHQVKIQPNDYGDFDIFVKYQKPEGGLSSYYVPTINYFAGKFTCDLMMPASIRPEYPDGVKKIQEGLSLTIKVVEEIRKIMEEMRPDDK